MTMRSIALAVAAVVLLAAHPHAQWLKEKLPNTPRLPDGSANLRAPVPRTANGKPDLSGVWEVVGDRVMPTDGRAGFEFS